MVPGVGLKPVVKNRSENLKCTALVCVGGGGGEETAAGPGRWRPVLCGGKTFGRTVARDEQAPVLILGEAGRL